MRRKSFPSRSGAGSDDKTGMNALDSNARAIMEAAKGLTASQMARIANRLHPGVNYVGCNKTHIAKCLTDGGRLRGYGAVIAAPERFAKVRTELGLDPPKQTLGECLDKLVEYMRAPQRLAELYPGKRYADVRDQLRKGLRADLIKPWVIAAVARKIDTRLVDNRTHNEITQGTARGLRARGLKYDRKLNDDERFTEYTGWRFETIEE